MITSKIKKTCDFDIVIKSINLDNLFLIKNKDKIIFTYLDFLKKIWNYHKRNWLKYKSTK